MAYSFYQKAYYDLLACEHFHGLPDRNGISDEDIQATMELYNWVSIQQFLPSSQSPLIGGALLDLILSDFANHIGGSSPNVARFYSAHGFLVYCISFCCFSSLYFLFQTLPFRLFYRQCKKRLWWKEEFLLMRLI